MLNVELFATTHAIESYSMLNGCLGNIELPLFFIENVTDLHCYTYLNVLNSAAKILLSYLSPILSAYESL